MGGKALRVKHHDLGAVRCGGQAASASPKRKARRCLRLLCGATKAGRGRCRITIGDGGGG